ncbi:Uncharacterised protein [Yersinia aldovae]|uniref:Uncharacterized protein n=4 Tax=Yersinia aldovae TaxID=29483 RepID=A0A0T9UQZ3_YERAL|nr:hypothetical protein [Yersinia aldovae]CNJ41124.1 Uncharacterised protein [Yersinia aldovae]CNK62633.1 Uncharacterised protein [Yersinia aldovae]CNL62954.1 Uncharacterised protein [Yersinia aldovae]
MSALINTASASILISKIIDPLYTSAKSNNKIKMDAIKELRQQLTVLRINNTPISFNSIEEKDSSLNKVNNLKDMLNNQKSWSFKNKFSALHELDSLVFSTKIITPEPKSSERPWPKDDSTQHHISE